LHRFSHNELLGKQFLSVTKFEYVVSQLKKIEICEHTLRSGKVLTILVNRKKNTFLVVSLKIKIAYFINFWVNGYTMTNVFVILSRK